MNEFERRTLLSAAGIGALAAMSKAGPLNPPAGPVAPTGRTLDEVYDKIATPPAPGAPGSPGVLPDGRILIAGGSLTEPITISEPGSYVIAGRIFTSAFPGPPITVTASDVTLDLNGHTVSTPYGAAVRVSAAYTRIINGALSGAHALNLDNGDDCLVEGVSFVGCRDYAVSGNSNRAVVRGCTFLHTVSGGAGATAVRISGDMVHVIGCTVNGLSPINDPQGLTTYGIRVIGNGTLIAGNRVCTLPAVAGTGVRMDGTGCYRDNTVQGFSVAYGNFGGTNGGGNVAVI